MKERLVNLLNKAQEQEKQLPYISTYAHEVIADFLLANGVIVPPCKVGDTVYTVVFKSNFINSAKVVGFHLGDLPTLRGHARKEYLVCYTNYCLRHIDIKQIGKTVFLTREEAEKALAERSE